MITLISVPGTGGALMFEDDPGPVLTDPALTARGQFLGPQKGLNWNWFSVTYPASVFPMGPSVVVGINIVVYVCQNPRQFGIPCWQDSQGRWVFYHVLDGYSQGSIITSHVWRDEILNPGGRLHYLLPYTLGVIEYGTVCRCPGIAFGNTELCGIPVPPEVDGVVTGGISGPDDLTEAQLYFPANHPLAGEIAVYQHAAVGDLYADAPTGPNPWATSWRTDVPQGYDEWLVYSLIQNFDGTDIENLLTQGMSVLGIALADLASLPGLISLVLAVIAGASSGAAQVNIPIGGISTPNQLVGLIEALLNGGMFLAAGASPHGNYNSQPAIDWLTNLGEQYAA